MREERNTYKILAIIFGIILLVLVLYLAFDKYSNYQANKLNAAYVDGYNRAINDSVTQIYERTNNCGAITVFVGNTTRNLADVECLNAALEQAKNQGSQS